jgi:rhodanese-related sulfurtransferase
VAHSEERDDAAELGAEDLQVAEDEASENTHAGSDDLVSEHADDDAAEDADDEVATYCRPGARSRDEVRVYCDIKFESGDQLEEFNGKL